MKPILSMGVFILALIIAYTMGDEIEHATDLPVLPFVVLLVLQGLIWG